ncbi:hypothetical protein MCAP1_001424 [Malassezia caprae]|uniref:Uncharacterized protein n=1 Tax=Malassezia caprae TaxID=1381934 RepID=A0AAF0E9J2_9BASI|nr:hypothetical protein MCAP1_001424 [Malassezia caprae]
MHAHLARGEVSNESQLREQLSTVHVGRGGAGNVRSPSRDPVERKLREEEKFRALELQDEMQSRELQTNGTVVGRGGVGNRPHGGRGAPPPVSSNPCGEQERGRGLGNVASLFRIRSRSRSRSRDVRATSMERTRTASTLDQVAE